MIPKVSVIVPVYNVQEYLRQCLDSLTEQTLEELEVILVDDGSTDLSGSIVDEYAENHANFHAYHKENGGLGQARNYGIQFATGEYLAFLDSDDYVAADAYRKMYESAAESHADLVIGNVKRFNSKKIYRSGLHKKVFKETKFRTRLTESPELLYDTTSWNKLYKKSFWDDHAFAFPEGILYEDLPVTIPAHYHSDCTNVLTDVVYYWRARDGEDRSITQQRHELRNFLDRFAVMEMVDAFFEQQGIAGQLKELKDYKALSLDLKMYLNQLDEVDEDYLDVFFEKTADYLNKIDVRALERLHAIDRLKYYLVERGEKEKLLSVLAFEKNEMAKTKIVKEGGAYYGNYPYRDKLPKSLYRLDDELQAVAKIERVEWNGDRLTITGHNYIKKVDMKRKSKVRLRAVLRNPETDAETEVPVKLVKRTDVTHKKGIRVDDKRPLKRLYNYHWSGYEMEIDFTSEPIANLGYGKWELWFTLDVDGFVRHFRAGGPVKGKKPRPPVNQTGERLIFVHYNGAYDLTVEVRQLPSYVDDITLKKDELLLEGWVDRSSASVKVEWQNAREPVIHRFPLEAVKSEPAAERFRFQSRLPLDCLKGTGEKEEWSARVVHGEESLPLSVLANLEDLRFIQHDREAVVKIGASGNLVIESRKIQPVMRNVSWNENRLRVDFAFPKPFAAEAQTECVLALHHTESGTVLQTTCEQTAEGTFSGEFALLDECGRAKLDTGKWKVMFEMHRRREGRLQVEARKINVSDERAAKFPKLTVSGLNHLPYRTVDGNLNLHVKLHWDWIERGPRRQEIIRKVGYPLFRWLPMNKKKVVFESYWGRSYSCNPRAIYEYLQQQESDYRCIWVLNNENVPINGSGVPVRKNSWKYYYHLATAKYFINNANFPDFYEKRKKAVEVQTLHGTFLKTMGLDVPGEADTPEKRRKFLRRCSRWDYLTSPSRYMTDLVKRCYLYENEVLECGFPRNDVLKQKHSESAEAAIRERLGLPENKRVILYAPTWRVRNRFQLQLDLDRMQERLGEDYVVLLRLHYFVSNALDLSDYRGFAYNVSSYGDIQELYLIADMLVTDYSSVMFDYANLNRPMFFFTYDLEYYRDQLRGFYMDLEKEAPGPLVKTTEALIDSIEDIRKYKLEYGERLRKFRAKYCQFETGKASEYVVRKVFDQEEPASIGQNQPTSVEKSS
ncbi:MAG TPA: CDP-glycerol glycerophosphotransferase family protein [Bacillales bacterium]|nr:CDP-glycerol glycerophosphotransferase family protein [Bacillales bacterium]